MVRPDTIWTRKPISRRQRAAVEKSCGSRRCCKSGNHATDGYGRRQPKTRRFKNHIDIFCSELGYRRPVKAERERFQEPGAVSIESTRSHHLNAWNSRQPLEIGLGIVHSRKNHGRELSRAVLVQRCKQVAQVVVAPGPKLPGNMRECDANGSVGFQRTCSLNHCT